MILWIKWLFRQPAIFYYRWKWRKLGKISIAARRQAIEIVDKVRFAPPALKIGDHVRFADKPWSVTAINSHDEIASIGYVLKDQDGQVHEVLGSEDLSKG